MLFERRKTDSEAYTYLNTFPEDFSEFPILFKQEELNLLEGSQILEYIKREKDKIKKDHELVCQQVPEAAGFTLLEFTQMMLVTWSRMFALNVNGKKVEALIPLAGMFNQRRIVMTEWSYSTEQAGFVYTALEDIPRNQEIFTTYGEQDSMQLFLHYGFVSPNANLVRLKFQLEESMPIHRFKTFLLNNYTSRFFNCEADLKKPDMQQLLCWCRFCTFAGEASVLRGMTSGQPAQPGQPGQVCSTSTMQYQDADNEMKLWLMI